jgi:hypothetical protein
LKNRHPTVSSIPFYNATREGKECEISAHSDVVTSVHLSSVLTHENVSCPNAFTIIFLYAQALSATIPAIPRRSLPFFMCHSQLPLNILDLDNGNFLPMSVFFMKSFPAQPFDHKLLGCALIRQNFSRNRRTFDCWRPHACVLALAEMKNVTEANDITDLASLKAIYFKNCTFSRANLNTLHAHNRSHMQESENHVHFCARIFSCRLNLAPK